jgi:hypothetical protein
MSHFTHRRYDFLHHPAAKPEPPPPELSPEQIVEALALCREAVAEVDKKFADIGRLGGVSHVRQISTEDRPWKADDRVWFEQNPSRSHRARAPFPNEFDGCDERLTKVPPGRALTVLLRQVEPGTRIKTVLEFNAAWLPVPNDEAVIHALFEIAAGREPVPTDDVELQTLIEKYQAQESSQ